MTQIKNSLNAKKFPKKYETNFPPSQTIPDQTLSLRELLDRYARGIPIQGEKTPIYHGDDVEMPDLKKLDLSEIAALKDQVIEDIKTQQADLMKQEHEKQQAEALKRQKELFKQWKDEEEAKTTPTISRNSKSKKEDE